MFTVLAVGLMTGQAEPKKDQQVGPLDNYNVVWNSPSENSHGSMPLGNGDIGINAWVEDSGDLVLYVSKTDAWDENARLCKISRVRVKFDPPLAVKGNFRQELELRDVVIEIASKIQNQSAKISLWVDADQPVVRVEAESAVPVGCRAEVELWRLRERPLLPQEDYGYGDGKSPQAQAYKLVVLPDVVATTTAPQVVWYHRNTRSLYPVCLEVQNLEALRGQFADPLLNRTFGASLRGVDMVPDGSKALKSSKPAKRHQLSVCVLAERAETSDAWLKDLDRVEQTALRPGFDQSRQTTAMWWHDFWNRSWVFVEENAGSTIHVNGNAVTKSGGENAAHSVVTQGYVLQRFMNACSGRGGSPIKFNGSIFTVEKNPGASPETASGGMYEDPSPVWCARQGGSAAVEGNEPACRRQEQGSRQAHCRHRNGHGFADVGESEGFYRTCIPQWGCFE